MSWPAVIDLSLGAASAALGLGLVVASGAYSELGAAFPRAVGIALVALGAVLAVSGFVRRRPALAALEGSSARRVLFVAAMALWGLSLPWLGFLVSSAIGMAALTLVSNFSRWDARRVALHLAGHAALLAAFYVLLAYGLQVPLPEGRLF